jgi:hypothetical protein
MGCDRDKGWRVKRRIRLALVFSLLAVSVWMSWDNVFSDIAPIQAQAEQAACTIKKCSDEHGMTKMSRGPFGQSFEFTWKDGVVSIDCHRELYVVGARKCMRST